ncbi:MAG: hypothetical protein ACN4GZ_03885 [Acidimicrobiales bacterium]
MSQDPSSSDNSTVRLTEATIESVDTIQRGRRAPLFRLVAALLLACGVGAWIYTAATDDTTPVEVAEDDAIDVEADDSAESDEPSAGDEVSEPASSEMALDMGARMGAGPGAVVFDGGRFVALGYGPNGQTIRTSEDGLNWSESPITGLAQNSHIYHLTADKGVYAALVEQWDEGETEGFFGPEHGPKISIAHTTDLTTWTFTAIPQSSEDGIHTGVSGLALIDGDVVVVTQQYPAGPDEMKLLFEAGYLNDESVERYCGLRFTDDNVIQVQECSHEDFEEPDESRFVELEAQWNAATTDEERAAIEAELENLWGGPEGEVVAEIQPGTALHAELSDIYHGDHEADYRPTTTVLTGPLGEDLVASSLSTDGYVNSVVQSGGRVYMVITEGESGGTQMLASSDGRQWDEVIAPAGQAFGGELSAGGDSILFTMYEGESGPSLHISSDGGDTWAESILPSNLYGTHPMVVSGPAGYVAVLTGTGEPFEHGGPESMEVTRDGFTLTTRWGRESETITLTGQDGTVIYELPGEEMYGGDSKVVRTSPFSGTPTFLDPETGEELVTFTPEDFEASYQEMEQASSWVEPIFITEHYFSTDGLNWIPIEDLRLVVDQASAGISPVAVGDDEAIFAKHTWTEPDPSLFAFEEEGREPTEEEMNALEAWEMTAHEGAVEYIRIELGS